MNMIWLLKIPKMDAMHFKTPDGEYYLVSTKVKGESPQIGITPFTKENLQKHC